VLLYVNLYVPNSSIFYVCVCICCAIFCFMVSVKYIIIIIAGTPYVSELLLKQTWNFWDVRNARTAVQNALQALTNHAWSDALYADIRLYEQESNGPRLAVISVSYNLARSLTSNINPTDRATTMMLCHVFRPGHSIIQLTIEYH